MIRHAQQKIGIAVIDSASQRPRTARIQELDRVLARDPEATDARLERAGLLREDGQFEPAKRDYLELVRRKPNDFGVLNDFGTMVLNAGYRDAARSLFAEAVRHHPDNPMGHVNLADLLFRLGECEQARAHLDTALRIDPDHVHAHRGLANLLAEIGDAAGARRHRDRGFKDRFLVTLPYRGDAPPVSVLLLVSALGGNIPTSSILDDRTFQTSVLVTEYDNPAVPLPPHDVVFNGIGDADLCGEGLEAAQRVLQRTNRPVLNLPTAVVKTGRADNVARLRGVPNVIVPRMTKLSLRTLAGAHAGDVIRGNGFAFPVLARAPGFHTGHHFIRADNAEELAGAVAKFPGDDVWLIEQLDARDGAGMFRKFRVMIVGGKLYPLHLAISRNWKVHYFKADMADSAPNRAVDAAFLQDMPRVVGERGVAALHRIRAMLDLDYGGIDFAVSAQGDILFFEGNATMVMVPLAGDEKWAYRRPAFDAVFAAVRAMLLERAGRDRRSFDAARRNAV